MTRARRRHAALSLFGIAVCAVATAGAPAFAGTLATPRTGSATIVSAAPSRGGAGPGSSPVLAGTQQPGAGKTRASGTAGAPPRSGAARLAARHSAKRRTPAAPLLKLTQQTSWVSPGQPFDLAIAIAPSAAQRATALTLQVTVFARLRTRSAFDQTLSGTVHGTAIARTAALPVAQLPQASSGGVALHLAIVTTGGTAPPSPSTPSSPGPSVPAPSPAATVDLHCSAGSCHGVYPVVVTLLGNVDGAQREVAGLTTHLIYVHPSSGATRLEVALALPDATGSAATRTISSPSRLGAAQSQLLATEAGALAAHPDVPASLVLDGTSLLSLARSGRAADRQTLHQLVVIAANPLVHEICDPTFTSVDPLSFVQSGLSGELRSQIARGRQLLATMLGVKTASPEPWIALGPLDGATVDELEADGAGPLVVAPSSLSTIASSTTPTDTFLLDAGSVTSAGTAAGTGVGTAAAQTGAGTTPVIAADSGLSADFSSGNDPVLAAHRMLADLAEIYFDAPNATFARGVVAAAPEGWHANGAFLSALLAGLRTSPVAEPVTLSTLFSTVPGSSDSRVVRHLVTSAAAAPLPAAAIRSARQRLSAFESAMPSPAPPAVEAITAGMSDEILAAETAGARPASRTARLRAFTSLLARQTNQVTLTPDRTIILTARASQVPITVTSRASFPVRVVLHLTSDKIKFLHNDQTMAVVLDRPTSAFDVAVRARVSGDFPLTVTLTTPTGGLVVASGQFTVRSTAISAVAIILTAGALAVLVGWWLRTVVIGRRKRRTARRTGGARLPAGAA